MDKRIKAAVTAVTISALVIFSVFTFYDLNGKSFDVTDREVRLIVTGSMDA